MYLCGIRQTEMTEEQSLFIQQILEERDRLYQENVNLKSELTSLRQQDENVSVLHSSNLQTQSDYYEQRAQEATSALSEKEAIIDQQENKLRSQNKTIGDQQEQILYLKHQVDKLRRQIWGQKSEKYIPEDPQQRWLDFEGLDLLPEEKQLASGIADEIKIYKENRTQIRKKGKPAVVRFRRIWNVSSIKLLPRKLSDMKMNTWK